MVVGVLKDYSMNIKFKNKLILVTGSTQGIGFCIGKNLLDLGANVIFNSRSTNLKQLKKLKKNSFQHLKADVSNYSDSKILLKEIKKNFGLLDHIVCNVGDGSSLNDTKGSFEEIDSMIKKNLFPATNIIANSPNFMVKKNGSIVCISSICGFENLGAPPGYQVAKAALNMYVSSIAKYLYDYKIRINAVAPGNIIFEGSVWEDKIKSNEDEVMNMLKKEVILNRFGKPEEISNFVAFLLSSFSSFSTGKTFIVDGGQTKGI